VVAAIFVTVGHGTTWVAATLLFARLRGDPGGERVGVLLDVMWRPLGTSHAALHHDDRTLRTWIRLFGVDDFHSHFRWAAVRRYIDWNAARTLEVGANSGVMTFEIAPRLRGQIVSSEFDPGLLAKARFLQDHFGASNVELGHADLRALALEGAAFDQALVVDVLEHIDDHEQAVRELAQAVRSGGRLIVSVPTPNYPEVFGREFHAAIGHVRDGYWLEDIQALVDVGGFRVAEHHYYTGRMASRGCHLFYAGHPMSRRKRLLAMPVMRALGALGERNVRREHAASLALVAIRA
jgi:SAM-dependent methyltransferase